MTIRIVEKLAPGSTPDVYFGDTKLEGVKSVRWSWDLSESLHPTVQLDFSTLGGFSFEKECPISTSADQEL